MSAAVLIRWNGTGGAVERGFKVGSAHFGAAVAVYVPVIVVNSVLAPNRMENESKTAHANKITALADDHNKLSEQLWVVETAIADIVFDTDVVEFVFPMGTNENREVIQLPQHYVGEQSTK